MIEKEEPPENLPHTHSASEGINFSITQTACELSSKQGHKFSISLDDFQLLREGTVTPALKMRIQPLGLNDQTVIEAARRTVLPLVNITVSQSDNITGIIRNGSDGLVAQVRQSVDRKGNLIMARADLIRFNGQIGPVYLIDGEARGLGLTLNGIKYAPMPINDFYSRIRQELSVPGLTLQKLKEVLNAWVQEVVSSGQAVNYLSSPIYVQDGIIQADFPHVGDLQDILARLRNFYDKASHPLAYRTVLAWSLLAPLHDELKRDANVSRRIQTPQIMMAGKTQGGKTPLGDFFIGKGFAMPKDAYFFPFQTVRTTFTLMKHLGETNIPALFDDLPGDWLQQHKDDLKAYVQTGHFGDRGKSDQTVQEYRGRRSFIGTVNSSIRIDDDLATSMRIIILRFTERNRRRKNLPEWNALIDGLPDGFMLEIFRVMFEGQSIRDIARDAEKFQTPVDWVNYVLGKLNLLSQWYGLPEWPPFKEEDSTEDDSNALEVAQAFLAEWERIQRNSEEYYDSQTDQNIKSVKYRSPVEGEFLVEWRGTRNYIWFTGPAFKTLVARQSLRLPYRNATDFLNNVANSPEGVKVENEGKAKTKKIWGQALWCYCISVPRGSEETWE